MFQRMLLFGVAAVLGSVSIFAVKTIDAACHRKAEECYEVKAKCPVTQDFACHPSQVPESTDWFKVVTYATHYVCEDTEDTGSDCDVDHANKNNQCATLINYYASEEDCIADQNVIGTGVILSGALCAGSDPCD